MATRFYMIPNRVPRIQPPYGGWSSESQAVRRMMRTSAQGGKNVGTETLSGTLSGASGNLELVIQLVSEPLAAGFDMTTTFTYTFMMRGRELATSDNVNVRYNGHRVVSPDGQTVVQTTRNLLSSGSTSELATSFEGILVATGGSAAGGGHITSLGERFVVEFAIGSNVTGTTPQWEFQIGGSGTDHATTNRDTTGTVPWFEVSLDFPFAEPFEGWGSMI